MTTNKSQKKLYKKYEKALSHFLADHPHPEAILCGSFAQRRIHKDSDIDIFFIDDGISKIREEKYLSQNITLSVFISSYAEVVTVLEAEKSSFIRIYSSFIGQGKVITGNKGQILIEKARECLISPVPILEKQELSDINTSLEKYLKLGEFYSRHIGFFGFSIRMSEFINEMIRYYFMLTKNIVPNYKNTEKAIQDKKLKKLMKSYLKNQNVSKKYDDMEKIIEIINQLLKDYKS